MKATIARPIGPAITPACFTAEGKLKIPVPIFPLKMWIIVARFLVGEKKERKYWNVNKTVIYYLFFIRKLNKLILENLTKIIQFWY